MEKDVISKGLSESALAGSSEFGVNDAGTSEKGDTRLTQPCSVDVHDIRKSLALIRAVHGADTPLGHRCSNLIEQLKNLDSATGGHRALLLREINDSLRGFGQLTKDPRPAEDIIREQRDEWN